MNRRQLLGLGGLAGLASAGRASDRRFGPIVTFGKHLQWLSYEEVAAFLEENRFDGLEATVRKGGQVEPENVERDLPRLVAALKGRGRTVELITTDIKGPEDPLARRVIQVADDLGIRFFRMAYFRYDLDRPVLEQLETHRQTVHRLAEYLRDFRIAGLYQNHSGSRLVGASIWDQLRLLEGAPNDRVAAVFDVRHVTVEGGESWRLLWRLIRDRVRFIYVKDFQWVGHSAVNVPLGQGQVDPELLRMVHAEIAEGTPLSLHMEYVDHRDRAKKVENMEAIAADRVTLERMLGV